MQRGLWHDKRAATALEYGIIAALVVVVIIAAVMNFATSETTMWTHMTSTITSAMN